MNEKLNKISKQIALASLKIGAIKINPHDPFQWASGTFNPIYNDNRMLLGNPGYRQLVVDSFMVLIDELSTPPIIIAGTSTAGIPWATLLANELFLPMVYVRDRPKDHGLRNQIEGIDAHSDLAGNTAPLIEDLISTGGSSVSAVAAIRRANGICDLCLSIFNYGLPKPPKMFAGEIPYNKEGDTLSSPCEIKSLLYYPELLSVGIKEGYIKKEEEKILLEWMEDQPNWGEKHGFPPVKK